MDAPTSPCSEMRIPPNRAAVLTENLTSVLAKIASATNKSAPPNKSIRLVAVSKLKPATDILALHSTPPHKCDHFGENYSQELISKASLLPRTINWHFIGALQTNKCKPLAEQIPNLWCVESVDTSKKVDQLEKGRSLLAGREEGLKEVPLRVFVQVNTSGEAEKAGVEPRETLPLCKHIIQNCSHLKLQGLMTIGAIARSKAVAEGHENEDFIRLKEVRDSVAEELGVELELSMGMSDDFESAIRCGSDEVRVGTGIFGERPKKGQETI